MEKKCFSFDLFTSADFVGLTNSATSVLRILFASHRSYNSRVLVGSRSKTKKPPHVAIRAPFIQRHSECPSKRYKSCAGASKKNTDYEKNSGGVSEPNSPRSQLRNN